MDRNQREARRQQEDKNLNRGLIWVGGAIVLEGLLMLVNRYYINYRVSEVETAYVIRGILKAARIGGAVVGIAALVWALLQLKKGSKALVPTALGLGCLAVSVCAHVAMVFKGSGMRMLFLLVPAWAGLALVYYLYQREFFLAAAASGMSVLGLWFVRGGKRISVETILILVAIVAVAAVTAWLKKNEGMLMSDGREIRLLPKKCNYIVVLASCLVGVATMAIAILLGETVAYYLIFLMIVWLFALLVYYTVKLM